MSIIAHPFTQDSARCGGPLFGARYTLTSPPPWPPIRFPFPVGDGILNLKGLEEEIQEAQAAFLEWFNREVEMLRQALGVKFSVTAYFDKMNLKDEEKFMAVLLQLYQNGLIDPQTALETMRFNYPTVVRRLEVAMKQRKKGIFVPLPSSNNIGPDGGILGPQGGKPVGQPKKANQQKIGTSQPKKAKATLIPIDAVTARLVVDTDLAADEREQLAEKFSIPAEWVVTEDEYQKATGKRIDWLPPLPDLPTAAAWAAMRHAQRIEVDIKAEVEKEIAAIRATGTGKRGKYVTDKLAGETMERVTASFIQKLRPDGVSAEEWAERKSILTETLRAEAGDKPEGDLRVMAACTLQAQYLRRAAAGK